MRKGWSQGKQTFIVKDELKLLLGKAEAGFDKTILETLMFTGMRHGEGLAPMWSDINFDLKEIILRRNWAGNYRKGVPVFHNPKTESSIRKNRIPDQLVLSLKEMETSMST